MDCLVALFVGYCCCIAVEVADLYQFGVIVHFGCLCPACSRGFGPVLFGWFDCWPIYWVWCLVCLSIARDVG